MRSCPPKNIIDKFKMQTGSHRPAQELQAAPRKQLSRAHVSGTHPKRRKGPPERKNGNFKDHLPTVVRKLERKLPRGPCRV